MATTETAHPAPPRVRRDPMPPALLGVILFVASECIFFAALFGAYFTVRAQASSNGQPWPPAGIEHLKIPLTATATAMLVLSSVTMQFAIWAIRRGDRRTMMRFLKLTLALGALFLGIQGYDYSTLPFSIHDTVFGTTFFTMTGFHGAHVAGGLVFIYLMLARGWQGQLTRDNHTALEACAIYWHFVDIVWIGLFSTLYLLR